MYRNTENSYGLVAKVLHWLIFFLILGLLLVGFFMDDISDKALKGQIINLHKLIGITVLGLMIVRAIWALMNPKPLLPINTPVWQRMAERTVHYLIYVALICMPISGWVMSVAAGHPPHFFETLLTLPIPENKTLSDAGWTIHQSLAWIIIGLISIHVLAALYHAVIKKDEVLSRML